MCRSADLHWRPEAGVQKPVKQRVCLGDLVPPRPSPELLLSGSEGFVSSQSSAGAGPAHRLIRKPGPDDTFIPLSLCVDCVGRVNGVGRLGEKCGGRERVSSV